MERENKQKIILNKKAIFKPKKIKLKLFQPLINYGQHP